MKDEGTERRLTTILAAEVVGYSRLMGRGEDQRSGCRSGSGSPFSTGPVLQNRAQRCIGKNNGWVVVLDCKSDHS